MLMSHATDSAEINVVIAAACVPAIRPVFLILFHRPGASYYRSSASRHKSNQVHPSSHDRLGNDNVGHINPVISPLKGLDGDGEGLVPSENRIVHTVEMDIRYEEDVGHEESSGRPTQIKSVW